jgi:hypothetical protein
MDISLILSIMLLLGAWSLHCRPAIACAIVALAIVIDYWPAWLPLLGHVVQ